jgi:hypothetical protein
MPRLPSGGTACACLFCHPLETTHVAPAYEQGTMLRYECPKGISS